MSDVDDVVVVLSGRQDIFSGYLFRIFNVYNVVVITPGQ